MLSFTLKSKNKTYSYDYKGALSVLLLAQKNGAKIWLESETHYFDAEIGDIIKIKEPEKSQEPEKVNENTRANKRDVKGKKRS